ncbi:UDP-glucuronosyltransferase 2A1-like [Elysia marginata]|uniref:UDP-glucuronosyltransferase 2A1-like n=1 Tax=Elysia marginata TaxID=1093978 RepID=A0AAV4FU54_9GAST|nr:UDP-glucuronosyltransferase 2A1-like [Elysia marginata]
MLKQRGRGGVIGTRRKPIIECYTGQGLAYSPPVTVNHVTNESVRELVVAYVGPQEPLLATVKRRKLAWFGHVTRHDSLSKTILQATVEGKRRRGRQRKAWCDNIKEWTEMAMYELVRSASDRDAWRQKTDSSALRSPRRPHRSRD